MSDKATVEITAPHAGKVSGLTAKEGETVRVGKPLCDILEDGEEASGVQPQDSVEPSPSPPPSPPPPPPAPSPDTGGAQADEGTSAIHPSDLASDSTGSNFVSGADAEPSMATTSDAARTLGFPAASATTASSSETIKAIPAVRWLAKQLNVALAEAQSRATGPQGRIEAGDVLALAHGATATTTQGAGDKAQEIKMSRTRSAMYKAMSTSASVPHFLYTDTFDVTALERARRALNRRGAPGRWRGGAVTVGGEFASDQTVSKEAQVDRLTLLPLLLKALISVLPRHPLFLSTPTDASSLRFNDPRTTGINLGVAVSSATSPGLFTPTIAHADALANDSVWALASALAHIQRTAPRFPAELRTGARASFTVSNIGAAGGGGVCMPVLPPGAGLAIAALGRVRVEPVYDDQQLATEAALGLADASPPPPRPRLRLPVSVSADHRYLEGRELANLVEDWKACVENGGTC